MEQMFKSLGDKHRLEIFLIIAFKPHICLCHIEICFNLSTSNLSRHLKELESAQLIISEKKGKWKYYQISNVGNKFIDLIKELNNPDIFNLAKEKSKLLSRDNIC